MNWYVLQKGQQIGPLTKTDITQMIADHRLDKTDLVWNETLPDWIEAGNVRELRYAGGQESGRSSSNPAQINHKKSSALASRKPLFLFLSILIISLILVLAAVLISKAIDQGNFGQNQQTESIFITPAISQNQITQISSTSNTDSQSSDTDSSLTPTAEVSETESQIATGSQETAENQVETETRSSSTEQVSQTETDVVDSSEEPTVQDTTQIVETLDESKINIDIEAILEIMHQADTIALDHFRAAFEAELADEEKVPFMQIRPDLLLHRSQHHVDTDLAVFYEQGLFEWGFEMNQVFPFHDKTLLQESFGGIVSQTNQAITVYTAIEASSLNEAYAFYTVLVYDDGKWVIDEQYSGD